MELYVWTTVWNPQDSMSVHQSNTALHIQPQQRLDGGSECTQTAYKNLRVMNADPGGASGFEEM